MTDSKKFKILIIVSVIVTVLALSYSLAQEYIVPDMENYVQRRLHYSQVISKKNLSLYKALYWEEKK